MTIKEYLGKCNRNCNWCAHMTSEGCELGKGDITMIQTKFDVDEIVYIPFVVSRIEIDGVSFNGRKRTVLYQLKGKNVIDGTCIEVEETDFNKPGFEVKTARDFK